MFPSGFYCMLNSSWQTFTCFFTPSSWHQSCSHWSAFWDRFLSNNQPPRPCIWFDFTFVWFGLSFDFRCALKNTVLFAKCLLWRKMCSAWRCANILMEEFLVSFHWMIQFMTFYKLDLRNCSSLCFAADFCFTGRQEVNVLLGFSTHVGSSMSPRLNLLLLI